MKEPPGWPSKKVKIDRFSTNLFAKDTCQTLHGPSQVFDWSSQVLGGHIWDLTLSRLHLLWALWSLQNMYLHCIIGIKRCSTSISDLKGTRGSEKSVKFCRSSKATPLLTTEPLRTCKSRKWIVPNALYSYHFQLVGLRSAQGWLTGWAVSMSLRQKCFLFHERFLTRSMQNEKQICYC